MYSEQHEVKQHCKCGHKTQTIWLKYGVTKHRLSGLNTEESMNRNTLTDL